MTIFNLSQTLEKCRSNTMVILCVMKQNVYLNTLLFTHTLSAAHFDVIMVTNSERENNTLVEEMQ